MNAEKCVLAFSGGLDTSAIVVWLKERGYEVHAILIDVGQDEDLEALCAKALRLGAESAIVRDAKPAMLAGAATLAVGLAATYEGNYRLGTALARPFIAAEQVKLAKKLGGATLVHGATGKGNDQIRFEFAYRSLAPQCPVLAPWKTWEFSGRIDLIDYLRSRGFEDDYQVTKEFSLDENLWHLSVEGGALEDPTADLDVQAVLGCVSDRFARGGAENPPESVALTFAAGEVTAVDGRATSLGPVLDKLNRDYRHASWGWDLVIENRFTGIKSRGVYINPGATLLYAAIDALARSCLNKPLYDEYVELGRKYGALLYRGEYFSEQRVVVETAARAVMRRLCGTVTVRLRPALHVTTISAADSIFRREAATFDASDYAHGDARGFINLSWGSSIGRSFEGEGDEGIVEGGGGTRRDVRVSEPVSRRRLVSDLA